MDGTSARLLALAREIAPAYADTPEVVAVLVGGSAARGHADRWSDLELGIVWSAVPAEDARTAAATAAGAVDRRLYSDASLPETWEEDYVIDGVKVDVAHLAVDTVDRVVGDVTERSDPTLAKQVLVSTVRHGLALHGAALLARWQASASAYPDALVRTMVEQHLVFGPHWWLEMLAERDDLPYLYQLLCRVEHSVLGALLGLNRVYPPSASLKWAGWIAGELTVAPPDLSGRLKFVLRAEPRDGVDEARRLIEETVDLVEAHLPSFDTGPVRARLSAPPRPGTGTPSNPPARSTTPAG